jgi:hypothetical protein
MALMWSLWTVFSNSREVGAPMVLLTIVVLVSAVAATLGGPDDALDRTAARRWAPRRAAHLLAALAIVLLLLLATLLTGARFGPATMVVRDTAGLLGLTALGATTLGPARSWFPPLGWTLPAIVFPQPDRTLGQILTWQSQAPDNKPAAAVAAALAIGGLIAYAWAGPALRTPAEAAM